MTRAGDSSELQTPFAGLADKASAWLFDAAFPLWADAGRDSAAGGFHERLTLAAQPTTHSRRAFVQARQAYCFCEAGRLGWTGNWAHAALGAADYLLASFLRPNGAVIHKTDVHGRPVDTNITLYDCAFAIFALAHVFRSCGRRKRERDAAEQILAFLRKERTHPIAGFFDTFGGPQRQNPHMHLLEAALAWIVSGGDDRWWVLAEELVTLAERHLVDARTGAIVEEFSADWCLPSERHLARIEPGHQYEWAYLLSQWYDLKNSEGTLSPERLFLLAERFGRDRQRGVAVCALDADLHHVDVRARLWAQTERLRAAVALLPRMTSEARATALVTVMETTSALDLFLDAPVRGLWRDDYSPDGVFADDFVRASSLYHLVSGYTPLIERYGNGLMQPRQSIGTIQSNVGDEALAS